MDAFSAALRRERATRVLLPLFFVSGATGLVYQTLWARQLHLVFGTSGFAIATVLAAFMAGLAAGGFAMARRADRVVRPLRIYALLELGIGVYALLFPHLLQLLTPIYLSLARALDLRPVGFGLVQFGLVATALVVPTALMGATLPVLARFATDRLAAAGDRVGVLYGVNTAGAVCGTWLAGFVLLPGLGLFATNVVAAVANLLLALAALGLDRWSEGAESAPVEDDLGDRADGRLGAPRSLWRLVVVVAGLAGFAALVYEVAWTRVLGLILGGSAYAFSVMLLAFLTGIAAGGVWGGRVADRVLARRGVTGVLVTLALVEVGVAGLSFALMFVFPELPYWYVWLFDAFGARESSTLLWSASLLIAGLVMTPPAVLMGAAFPLTVRVLVRRVDALGAPVGMVYGANTSGSVLGAFLAGFVLLPAAGLQGTILVAVGLNLLAAALLIGAVRQGARRWWAVGGLALALAVAALLVRPPWDPMMMTAGLYKYVSSFKDHSREGIRRYTMRSYELVFYEEGLSSVVTVVRNTGTGNLWLANNGKVDASSHKDMPTQLLLAAAPMQHTEGLEDALVIGLASGTTAGAIALADGLERLDIFELEPAVGRAALLFNPYNFRVLDDPRVVVHYNDGRNQLLLTPEHSYDLVVSEPPNPWISGVSNLFTREFFLLGKSRLRPGGVWAQWVQMYAMDRQDLGSMLTTFASVYDHVLVYATPARNDLVVVGSDRPLHPGPEAAERIWTRWPALGDQLSAVGIDGATDLVALHQLDRDGALAFADGAPINTDDNMRIEYSAPLNLHRSTADDNSAAMVPHRHIPLEAYTDDPEGLATLATAYRAREDWVRAIMAMHEAARWVEEGDPRHGVWMGLAQGWERELMAELTRE
jgi:spermidine synthase